MVLQLTWHHDSQLNLWVIEKSYSFSLFWMYCFWMADSFIWCHLAVGWEDTVSNHFLFFSCATLSYSSPICLLSMQKNHGLFNCSKYSNHSLYLAIFITILCSSLRWENWISSSIQDVSTPRTSTSKTVLSHFFFQYLLLDASRVYKYRGGKKYL